MPVPLQQVGLLSYDSKIPPAVPCTKSAATCKLGAVHMAAWLGLGSIAGGGYLSFNIGHTQVALSGIPDGFGEIILVVPGLSTCSEPRCWGWR